MTDEDNKDVENEVKAESTAESVTAEAVAPAATTGDASSSETASAEAAPVETGAADAATIESLMQDAANNPALENRAMAAAAEAAIKEGERALASAARAVAQVSGVDSGPAPEPEKKLVGKRLMVLRALLLFNVVMMGVMIVMPDPPVQSDEVVEAPVIAQPPVEPDPLADSVLQSDPNRYVSPTRHPDVMPDSDLMSKAFTAASKGEYSEAVEKIQTYLAAYPEMNPQLRILALTSLSSYLRLDGRKDEALKLEIRIRSLSGSSNYPADLLKRARQAMEAQDFHETRRAYAKFLLTQKTIGPAMRSAVTEAYLMFGDSYRLEAGLSDLEAIEQDRLRHSEQMPSEKDDGSASKRKEDPLIGPSLHPPEPKKSGGH